MNPRYYIEGHWFENGKRHAVLLDKQFYSEEDAKAHLARAWEEDPKALASTQIVYSVVTVDG